MKIRIGIVAFLFIFSACKKEKVGGKCEYTDIDKMVLVSFIDGELDADFMVSFQPIDVDTDEIYRITAKQFKEVKTNFKLKTLSNKENTYKLIISERIKGSCVPFVIKEITLQK